ncbi:TPA: hypothetical protein ACXYKD_000456 [Legionella anisa]
MTVEINFRCAFLKYLLDPSNDHKKELITACNTLYDLAQEKAMEGSKDVCADEGCEEVDTLVKQTIKGLCITKKQIQAIQAFKEQLAEKSKEKAIKMDTVLTAATETLKEEERIISDEHYKAFSSIYPLELDGHRIIKKDPTAGQATLTLSEKLMEITLNVCNKNNLDEHDKVKYTQAYAAAKNQGIENHRGAKEKFQNFCIAVSCIFIFPIFIYASQDSFWSTAKTKTQEDVENSQDAINEFQQSFQKQ